MKNNGVLDDSILPYRQHNRGSNSESRQEPIVPDFVRHFAVKFTIIGGRCQYLFAIK